MTPQPPPAADRSNSEKPRRAWIWITALALPAIAGLTFGFYIAFAAFIPDPLTKSEGFGKQEIATQELAIARMETQALRNALAATGGLGVLVALAVTIRRQFHHEHATRDAQAAELRRQVHLEAKAADEKDDAIQRRITDMRIRAVEQLGSDQAAVRIGGLHNLERIGQRHDELRQVVLDEVCAYLRQPYAPCGPAVQEQLPERQFEPIGPPPTDADGGDEAEHEVRLIAQEILQRHLNPDDPDRYWTHTRLNLRNARLDSPNLRGCHLTGADFTGATFTGRARFGGATFTGRAHFAGATFSDVTDFGDVAFAGRTTFENVTFTGGANFSRASCGDIATFAGATFTGGAVFVDAIFTGGAAFGGASFIGRARFAGATFSDVAFFGSATFGEYASFDGVIFTSDAIFAGAVFTSGAVFAGTIFGSYATFDSVTFESVAYFGSATFTGVARFAGATFTGIATFEATFEDSVEFEGVRFQSALRASPALVEALRAVYIRLRINAEHRLPEEWGLVPYPTASGWGRLVNQTAPDSG